MASPGSPHAIGQRRVLVVQRQASPRSPHAIGQRQASDSPCRPRLLYVSEHRPYRVVARDAWHSDYPDAASEYDPDWTFVPESDCLEPCQPEPWRGPADASELGAAWHFKGRRRWEWLHNGSTVTGWIEFGQGGALRTSFDHLCQGGPPGYWTRAEGDELIVTFGNCHHMLHLVPNSERPEFKVTERVVFTRKQHDKLPPTTRGRLDMMYYGQSENDNLISQLVQG